MSRRLWASDPHEAPSWPPAFRHVLEHGFSNLPADDPDGCQQVFAADDAELRRAWYDLRDDIRADWFGPGQPYGARFEEIARSGERR